MRPFKGFAKWFCFLDLWMSGKRFINLLNQLLFYTLYRITNHQNTIKIKKKNIIFSSNYAFLSYFVDFKWGDIIITSMNVIEKGIKVNQKYH